MEQEQEKKYNQKLSASFARTDDHYEYEIVFRRWLVQEIEQQRITPTEAIKTFNFHPKNGLDLIRYWRKKYAPEMVLPLPEMTEAEKQKIDSLKQQLAALEKQLEDAKMRNIALNTLIDVAEEKLKINIRKKPGAKQ